eukprot:4437623-Prymnesium_polylepis.3
MSSSDTSLRSRLLLSPSVRSSDSAHTLGGNVTSRLSARSSSVSAGSRSASSATSRRPLPRSSSRRSCGRPGGRSVSADCSSLKPASSSTSCGSMQRCSGSAASRCLLTRRMCSCERRSSCGGKATSRLALTSRTRSARGSDASCTVFASSALSTRCSSVSDGSSGSSSVLSSLAERSSERSAGAACATSAGTSRRPRCERSRIPWRPPAWRKIIWVDISLAEEGAAAAGRHQQAERKGWSLVTCLDTGG